MSLLESDRSAASCARRDSVLIRNGRSTFRCVWTFSRSSGGVANNSSEVELRPWFVSELSSVVTVILLLDVWPVISQENQLSLISARSVLFTFGPG